MRTLVERATTSLLVALVIFIVACEHRQGLDTARRTLSPRKKWEFRTSSPLPLSPHYPAEVSPAIGEDGTIYAGGTRGLFAINPDGSQRWLYEPPGPVTISPVLDDGGTIWISSLAELHHVNPDGHGTPVIGLGLSKQVGVGFDGTIYMGTDDGLLEFGPPDKSNRLRLQGNKFAFGPDGRIYTLSNQWPLMLVLADHKDHGWVWIGGGNDPSWHSEPAIATDGTVYIGVATQIEAFSDNGGGIWSFPADLPTAPSIGSDGSIYFGSRDHHLYAITPDGNLKWAFSTGDAIESAPAISKAGIIYFGSNDNKLYAVDGSGHELWEFVTEGAVYSPTIAPDGTIYVQSSDGNLYAIQDWQVNGGLDGQWPKLAGGLKNMARGPVQHGN